MGQYVFSMHDGVEQQWQQSHHVLDNFNNTIAVCIVLYAMLVCMPLLYCLTAIE